LKRREVDKHFVLSFKTKMDEFESCVGNLDAYAAVRQRLEAMVLAQQQAHEQRQHSVLKRHFHSCVNVKQIAVI